MANARGRRSLTRGERNAAWIESHCRVPEGAHVGKQVKLRDWQRDIICGIYDTPTRRAIVSFGRKNGKGLALDTPIPTPSGWTTMGKLQVGDQVFGSDGKPTAVEFVSPVHTGLRCWRLTFSDGSSIVADEQHRWLTTHRYRPWTKSRKNGSGNGGRWRKDIVTTPQIADSVHCPRADGVKEHNHKIAAAPATESHARDLPLDPYALGAWLGDGTSCSGTFTCGEQDIAEMTAHLSAAIGGQVSVARYGERAPTIKTGGLGFKSKLRALGVIGNKHIPQAYLDAGTQQRWALLQGLMDTDGTVSRNGGRYHRASFTGTNELLCRQTWILARSLGLKATIKAKTAKIDGREIGTAWSVSFHATIDQPVFRLARKQELLPATRGKRSGTLTITSCEEVKSVQTVCIKVAASDSLFLAGYGSVPTHNTALACFLTLLHLCGPEAKANSQLYSAAQSREQAAILFALAAKVVRMSPDLNAYVTVRDTAKQLYCAELGTLYRALSAEASTAYGLSPVFTVHDELGQVKGPRSELYEALETASGAQEEPLSVIISTQAPTDADLLSTLIDDAKTGADPKVKLFLYTVPVDADPFSENSFKLANPAYGDFQNPEEVKDQAARAKRMPTSESAFRNLILNQRVSLDTPFIPAAIWKANASAVDEDAFRMSPVYGGLDLSARHDLTAFVTIARGDDGYWNIKARFWMPEQGIRDKAHRDRVPYDVWAEAGYIELTPGSSVDYEYVAQRIAEDAADCNLVSIGFDRWRIDVMQKELDRIGAALPLEPVGQGFKDMTPALDMLEGELIAGRIRHGSNPVLNMCAVNAKASRDPAGNVKLDKIKSNGRIDGLVALAMACSRAATMNDAPETHETPFIDLN